MDTQANSNATGRDDAEKHPDETPTSSRALRALGWAVRKRRKELSVSQERLGERSGLHRNYVGGIERGEQNPSYVNLRKLAAGLDLSLTALVERADAELATLPE